MMNFNNQKITSDTDTIPMKNRDTSTLSLAEVLIGIYMSTNEPQTLRDRYSRDTEILDNEYKQVSVSLDEVIRTCEKIHIDKQHKLKILFQKHEHLFDGILGECNMEP
jgi:hypothetical protein